MLERRGKRKEPTNGMRFQAKSHSRGWSFRRTLESKLCFLGQGIWRFKLLSLTKGSLGGDGRVQRERESIPRHFLLLCFGGQSFEKEL